MATPQSVSIMQSTGGVLGQQPEAALMCEAFRDAVDQWCTDGKGNRTGDFNSYFFDQLQARRGGNTADMLQMARSRELAFLNPRTAGAAATVLATAGGAVGAVFAGQPMAMNGAGALTGGGFRWSVLRQFFQNPSMWAQGSPMFPDAMLRGTPVEIKGPDDLLGSKQAEKYEKIQGQGQIVVISCQSCKASCANDNKCPKPPPSP